MQKAFVSCLMIIVRQNKIVFFQKPENINFIISWIKVLAVVFMYVAKHLYFFRNF